MRLHPLFPPEPAEHLRPGTRAGYYHEQRCQKGREVKHRFSVRGREMGPGSRDHRRGKLRRILPTFPEPR